MKSLSELTQEVEELKAIISSKNEVDTNNTLVDFLIKTNYKTQEKKLNKIYEIPEPKLERIKVYEEKGMFFSLIKEVVDYVEDIVFIITSNVKFDDKKDKSNAKLMTAIDIIAKIAAKTYEKLSESTIIDMIEDYVREVNKKVGSDKVGNDIVGSNEVGITQTIDIGSKKYKLFRKKK